MAINTLITLRDEIQRFVDGHGQIKRVIFEADDHRSAYITEGDEFPVMFVAPIDVIEGASMSTHRLRVYIYERINHGREDVWENANDTSLMLRDLRVWFNSYYDGDINIIEDPNAEFLSDRELDKLVGYFSDFQFELPSHGRCDVPVNITPLPPEPTICLDATVNITNSDNDLLGSVVTPSGGVGSFEAPDGNVIVKKSDGSILKVDTVHSAGSKDINIADSIISLRDTGGSLLATINVKAEETANLVAPDARVINTDLTYDEDVASGSTLTLPDITVTDSDGSTLTVPAMTDIVCTPQIPLVDGVVDIRDTDNTLIGSQNVANNSTEDFIVPDSLITLKDTDGLTLQAESLKATQPLDLVAPDATVNITNSDNDLLGSVIVASGGVGSFEVPDENITVNGNLLVTKPSAQDYDVEVVDSDDNPIGVISGGKVVVADTYNWKFQFIDQTDTIQIEVDVAMLHTFASGSGVNIGTMEVSTDGVTYAPISYPFTPSVGTLYFKRSTALITATYTMIQ